MPHLCLPVLKPQQTHAEPYKEFDLMLKVSNRFCDQSMDIEEFSEFLGSVAGKKWACEVAHYKQLQELECISWQAEIDKLEKIYQRKATLADAAQLVFEHEWGYPCVRKIIGGRVTYDRLRGFCEAAIDVYKRARRLCNDLQPSEASRLVAKRFAFTLH